jgi:hypothetical protein
MPADGYVALPDLRFVTRMLPRPGAPGDILYGTRILQQRWVRAGTMWGDLTPENSEWRDVPLVEEG